MSVAASMTALVVDVVAWVVAPPRCAACDARVPPASAFCPACASTVERPARDDVSLTGAFVYGGAVARAIVRLKYERRPDLARPLGDLLWRALAPDAHDLHNSVVIPVPLHVARLAERGFNQSAIIACRIARRLGASWLPLALERTRDTMQQATLDRDGRIANVAGAFRVRQAERLRGRAVLLIDDVRTTGATMDACAAVLEACGAASVKQAVVALAGP
ncbi:MAG: ComF family protein [Polyangiaceae bacterium]